VGYTEDDALNAATSVQDVHQLVEQDHVVAIVGETSDLDSTWASYVQAQGIPVIGGLSIDLPMYTNPDFYPTGTNIVALNYALLQRASKVGHNFGFLYCAESPQCAQAQSMLTTLGKPLGVSIPVAESISAAAPSYTAQCQAVKAADITAYQPGSVSAVDLRVISDCDQQGVKASVIASGGTMTNAWAPAVPSGLLAVDYNSPWFNTTTTQGKAYQAFLKKYVHNIGPFNGPQSQYVWVAGQLFDAAAKAAGSSVTPASLKKALYHISGTTLDGLTQPLTFHQGKATVLNCWFDFTTQSGKFEAQGNNKPICGPNSVIDPIVTSLAASAG
jgi:branched-chain amino acid transport system substrate-binding protein